MINTKTTPHKIVYIRAAEDVYQALKDVAETDNRSMSNMAETIIRQYLEELGKLPKETALPSLVTSRAV